MKKVILITSICAVILVSTITIVMVLARGNEVVEKGDIVAQKETALKIGRALLEEHFPDSYFDTQILDAEEKNGIWKVHNVVQREGRTKDGKITYTYGGEASVEFRRSNGEIIKFEVAD